MSKIKIGSDFSGVGAFNFALKRIGIPYHEVFSCDKDKYARLSFKINHGDPDDVFEDVYDRTIPKKPLDIYVSTPPCQSFSLAGKRLGENDKRGILFYNTHEFICKNRPRYFIIENVKGLISDNSGKTFNSWCELLGGKSVNQKINLFPNEDAAPYHIYWQVINAKDYGVPQNRERVFIVGIRDDEDNNFKFPKTEKLTLRLKDLLETKVDKKYYISDTMYQGFIKHKEIHAEKGNGFGYKPLDLDGVFRTITTKEGNRADNNYIEVGYINQDTQASKVYSEDGIMPTICAGTHGYAIGYVEQTDQLILQGSLSGGKWDKTH